MKANHPLFIHYVSNMSRAIEFYRQVFEVDLLSESPGWSTFDFGNFELALHILSPQDQTENPIPHAGLNLLVDNIEAMQHIIETCGGKLTELREPNDFVPVRVASFIDCEGNGFELRQAV